ncbi:MAG: hypothetical protein IKN11_04160 [Bacteroidales bacterium]|nr:hypothetical protein [Bacteroidales bacterium]
MSLFRAIFAFGNGREVANLEPVFSECLRYAFALASLPEAKKRGRQAQGTASHLWGTSPRRQSGLVGRRSIWQFVYIVTA